MNRYSAHGLTTAGAALVVLAIFLENGLRPLVFVVGIALLLVGLAVYQRTRG